MHIIRTISERIENLLSSPTKELGRWARFLRFQIELWKFCFRRLRLNNAMAMSSALSFRTIFALIPTLALVLLMLKTVVPSENNYQWLYDVLHAAKLDVMVIVPDEQQGQAGGTLNEQTVPAEPNVTEPALTETSPVKTDNNGKVQPQPLPPGTVSVADEIIKLVKKVEQKLTLRTIGPFGAILLIWSALTLLTTMERSLNRIYGARQSRGLAKRVLLYWSVVTLGPILLTVTGYVGSQFGEPILHMPVLSGFLSLMSQIGPMLIEIVLLAALYKLMPNTTVSFRAAIGGALVAVPLWLVAKWAFALYVGGVGSRSIYGALGLLPIFLLWLNLSWTIFLFGAELSHTAANLTRIQAAEMAAHTYLKPTDMLAVALVVAREYQAGKGPVSRKTIGSQLNLPDEMLYNLLDRLVENKIICPVENEEGDQYVPARPPNNITLMEIMEFDQDSLLQQDNFRYGEELNKIIRQAAQKTRQKLGNYNLAEVLAEGYGTTYTSRV